MKKIIILALGLFTIISCESDDDANLNSESKGKVDVKTVNKKSDLEKEGLKGKVSSVRQIVYDVTQENGEVKKGYIRDAGLDNYYRTYNSNGNKTEQIIFTEDEQILEKENYIYNSYNQIAEIWKYAFNGSLETKTSFGYDENHDLVRKFETASDGNKNNSITYAYNSNGERTEEIVYNYADELDYRIVYIYKNTKKIEQVRYNYNNELEEKTIYSYDDKGNVIEEKKYEGEELLDRFVYAYNNSGKRILYEKYEFDGSLGFKSTYAYDKEGNIVREETFTQPQAPDFVNNYKYTYDEKGNWLTKTMFEGEQPISITERIIEYY